MKRSDNQHKFDAYRQQFSVFTFERQSVSIENGTLKLKFFFHLDEQFHFCPTLEIPARPFFNWNSVPESQLQTLAFHIGMVELVSYWKMACPKRVVVLPFALTDAQKQWWKKLYYNGLGEFFYLNGITCSEQDFMSIESPSTQAFAKVELPLQEKVIIPVGGGKDSVVTLELLRNDLPCTPLIVNPRGATLGCVEAAGFADDAFMVVKRTLDPTMLEMNKQGYLNGHTPFSALLAFVSILVGFGSGSRYIALSNESSANESTVPGTKINHQYSKSIEFECDFRNYIAENINDKIQYFSFLRPLSELQIAYFFAQFTTYHPVFRSCNAGSKTDSWCCKCPKCLFTWLILSPFLTREQLTAIFGHDMMADAELRPIFEELNGTSAVKPFECVGTVEEVRACCDAMPNKEGTLFEAPERGRRTEAPTVNDILQRYNTENFLPKQFATILKSRLHV